MPRSVLALFFAPFVLAQTPAAPNLLEPSTLTLTAPNTFRVKLDTTRGPIVIEVTRAWAPIGADRFYNLVKAGFYTDMPFYRVVPSFMAQFGISIRPEVNEALRGKNIPDDPRAGRTNNRGRVSFASTGAPNSRGNTLFINSVNNGFLDASGFVPIGEVVEGMENVDKLYNGYGETASHQSDFETGGKDYVEQTFPKLDRILTGAVQ